MLPHGCQQSHLPPHTGARLTKQVREVVYITHYTINTNLLGCAGGKEFEVVPLVTWDAPGQKDGIGPGIRTDILLYVLLLTISKCIGGHSLGIPMNPAFQTATRVVVFQRLKA